MKNILILAGLLVSSCLAQEVSAQQKQRLTPAQLKVQQANLPYKKPGKSRAEYEVMLNKRRAIARENQARYQRLEAEKARRERVTGPNRE